jgi:hypothetical protein
MKKIIYSLFITMSLVIMLSASYTDNTTRNTNIENGWRTLFNGKNLDGWIVKIHHHELGDNYANTFRVVDGRIQVNYDDYEEFNDRYGHLFYN